MKKKKKKIYNTLKKEKHKNKIPTILQFIQSFNNKRCNFCKSILAHHFNRDYCGKCNTNTFDISVKE